ncbi:TobH protein [Gordonia sinesedis]
MRTGVADLDDAAELVAADSEGLLHSVALAGAQVRSTAEAIREGALDRLADLRPRSVVILCGASATARAAADLMTTILASRIDVPLVVTTGLPGWIGPLDVVVIAGDDGGDLTLADGAARALRRRAEVVTATPAEGPLRDALGGNGIDLSPRVEVDPRFRFVGFVAALLAVLTSLSQVRLTGVVPSLADLADALDDEAGANHSSRESFHNRAKLLAGRLDDRPVVWTGDTPAALVIARRSADVLLAVAGTVGATTDLADVGRAWREVWSVTDTSVTDSIFYDPDIDGPRTGTRPRTLVVTTAAREWYTTRRIAGIGDAEPLVGDDLTDGPVTVAAHPPASPAADMSDVPADLAALLLLMVRVEMAAVYLRLIGPTAR